MMNLLLTLFAKFRFLFKSCYLANHRCGHGFCSCHCKECKSGDSQPSTAEGNQPVIEPPSTAEGNQPVIELSPPIGDFTQVEWMSYEFCEGYPPRLRSNQARAAAGEPELSMMCSTFRDATYSRYKITWFQIYLHEFLTDTQLIALQSERYNSFYL